VLDSSSGRLFVVGTPIGNLEDITLRAIRILKEVDLIAAEDTRRTSILLNRYQIQKPLISLHEFNERKRVTELQSILAKGNDVALVSDAGMPTISDPGRRLIHSIVNEGIQVEVIPGPSAITAALSISGFSTDRFFFIGFLPHKSGQRKNLLEQYSTFPYPLVFFESPYRLCKSLTDMSEKLGNRSIVIARELTKKFEELIRGKIEDALEELKDRKIKGEITIVVEGFEKISHKTESASDKSPSF